MHRGRFTTAGLAFALAAASGQSLPAIAAEESGTAVAVVQATEAIGTSGSRVLMATAPVFAGDRIRTGPAGEAQIRLRDDTRLVVGPNSSMLVDSFIYAGGDQARQVSLTAVRGAFRFITGSSPKDAYAINTPTATIGIRGTRFDFTVDAKGVLNFALFQGEARICDKDRRRCVRLVGACSVVVAPPNQVARPVTSFAERSQILDTMFPYVRSQARLRTDFRVDTSDCTIQRAAAPAGSDAAMIAGLPAPPATQPPPSPPVETGSTHSNNGFGNGGEGNEGPMEGGNPGQGNAGGNGGGNNGGGKP